MGLRKHFISLAITAAALLAAGVTYLLTSAKSPETRSTPESPPALATHVDTPIAATRDGERVSDPTSKSAARDHRTWMRELTDALIHRGDPHSLGAAALLMNAYAPELSDATQRRDAFRRQVLDLLHRAAEAAPDDVSVQSLALVFCNNPGFQMAGCDPQPYEDALAAIDPANAWPTAGELARANAAHDSVRQIAAIARIAKARRVDIHRIEMEALFTGAVESVAIAPADHADEDSLPSARRLTTTALNAAPVDVLDAVGIACHQPPSDGAHGDCRTIARLMRDSSDPLIADQGLRLAGQLAPRNSKEALELRQARRLDNWQTANFLRLPRSPEQNARFMRDRVPSAQLRREVLLQNGVPADPPADFLPLSEPELELY